MRWLLSFVIAYRVVLGCSSAQVEIRSKITFDRSRSVATSFGTSLYENNEPFFHTHNDLGANSHITIVTPPQWQDLSDFILETTISTHQNFRKLLGKLPPTDTTVRLVHKDRFHKQLNLPQWTNAIFFRGEIVIPLKEGSKDLEELGRSVQHEYVHALIHSLGDGKVPGWLDEGLAQWTEGSVHSSLPLLFKSWLKKHPFIPFSDLGKGFTKLEGKKVPVAYAQSLFSTQEIIRRFGFIHIAKYLRLLRQGVLSDRAFRIAFGEDLNEFQRNTEKNVRDRLMNES